MICPAGLLCPEGQAVPPDASKNACPRGYYCPQGDAVSASALDLGILSSLIVLVVQSQCLHWNLVAGTFPIFFYFTDFCTFLMLVFTQHKIS